MTYVELQATRVLVPRRRVAPRGARCPAAELGYPALALTDHDGVYGSLEFAHAAKPLGVRPITGAEVTLGGGAHVTLLVERPGHANLCRSSPRPTRAPGEKAVSFASRSPPVGRVRRGARRGARLPLRLRAPRSAIRDPNAAAGLAGAFGREHSTSSSSAVRARRRPPQRRAARPRRISASRPSPPATSTRTLPARRSRTRSSRSAIAPPSTAASRSGAATARAPAAPAEAAVASRLDPRSRPTVEVAERLEFDLTQDSATAIPTSRRPRPGDPPLAQICDHASRPLPPSARVSGAERLEKELALIDELGLAGFFLLHREVLELARECSLQVRGRIAPPFLPPGRGRGSSVGSIVCYLTGLSHVDRGQRLSLARFLNREMASVPTSTSTSPATSASS